MAVERLPAGSAAVVVRDIHGEGRTCVLLAGPAVTNGLHGWLSFRPTADATAGIPFNPGSGRSRPLLFATAAVDTGMALRARKHPPMDFDIEGCKDLTESALEAKLQNPRRSILQESRFASQSHPPLDPTLGAPGKTDAMPAGRYNVTRVSPVAWLVAPACLFFLVAFVLPFGVMALLSVLTGNPLQRSNVDFTARHFERILDDTLYLESLVSTLQIGAIVTIAALLLGYPIAHWLARMHSRTGHALLLMAVIAPMLTGIVVRTFAWMTILSDRGVINATLMNLGILSAPLPLMYNEFGTIVALVHIYVPFMVLTLAGVIGRIDERLEEAAMSLGASPMRAFLEVTLPLSAPGILAGSLLVFALAISAYVTPYLMGGQQVLTLPMLIYQQVAATFNLAFAGALGVVLLVVSVILVIAYNHVLSRLANREDLA